MLWEFKKKKNQIYSFYVLWVFCLHTGAPCVYRMPRKVRGDCQISSYRWLWVMWVLGPESRSPARVTCAPQWVGAQVSVSTFSPNSGPFVLVRCFPHRVGKPHAVFQNIAAQFRVARFLVSFHEMIGKGLCLQLQNHQPDTIVLSWRQWGSSFASEPESHRNVPLSLPSIKETLPQPEQFKCDDFNMTLGRRAL